MIPTASPPPALAPDAATSALATSPAGFPLAPAASSVVGGSTPVAVAAVLTFFAALALAVLVTYRIVEGYRRTRERPFLFLAVGIFLLAPAPLFLRFALANWTAVGLATRSLAVAGSELLGLLCILYTVYHR